MWFNVTATPLIMFCPILGLMFVTKFCVDVTLPAFNKLPAAVREPLLLLKTICPEYNVLF